MTNAPKELNQELDEVLRRPGPRAAAAACVGVGRRISGARHRRADPPQARPRRQPARLDRRPRAVRQGDRRRGRPRVGGLVFQLMLGLAPRSRSSSSSAPRSSASSPRTSTSTRRPTSAPSGCSATSPTRSTCSPSAWSPVSAFDAALQQVARNTEGPLAEEFSRVLREMQIGQGRADALRALGERTNVADLRTFVGAMVQADSFGIPVAQVLRVQSAEMRVKRRQRAEEKAQQVPVKITDPADLLHPSDPVHRGHGTGRAEHHGQLRQEVTRHEGTRTATRPAQCRGAGFVLIALLGPVLWAQDAAALLALDRDRCRLGARAPSPTGGSGCRSCSSSPSRRRWSAPICGFTIHSSAGRARRARRAAVHRRPLPLAPRRGPGPVGPAHRDRGDRVRRPSAASTPTRGSAPSAGA